MAVINTSRNMVFVHHPEPGHDVFVVTMYVPGDGSKIYKRLNIQTIDHWQAAVDWAVGMADNMVSPLRVAAIGFTGLIHLYGDELQRGVAAYSEGKWAVVRDEMLTTCAEALRECPDYDVRADAYDVLVKLGVFPC